MPVSYDVVILGGGPAGCASALALVRHGVARVRIIEAGRHEGVRIGESIPPDAGRVLDELGVLQAFLAEAHEPSLGSCSAWGSDELGYNDFLFNPLGHGWHLDRRRFDAFLAREAVARGVTLNTGMRLDSVERDANGFRLALRADDASTATITARFVVDATGARASFARHLGARRVFAGQLLCVAGYFDLADDFPQLTMLEAVEDGWWYAAKLPDRRIAVAVASDAALVKARGLNRRDAWHDALMRTRHIAAALGHARPAGDLVTIAAPSFRLDQVAGEGWLAVGDAACAFDPLSSQGIYKALVDGLEAAAAIAAFLNGQPDALAPYRTMVAARFDAYRETRNGFYAMERRWPHAPFWRRRQTLAPSG